MWPKLLVNSESIHAIYRGRTPSLSSIELRDINIQLGGSIIIELHIYLFDLPDVLPEKWVKNKVNTISIELSLVEAEIILLDLTNCLNINKMTVIPDQERIICSFLTSDNQERIRIKSDFIRLKSLTGYHREQ